MVLKTLRIKDFRNIADASMHFGPGLNLITGSNGEGKSNLLEAIGLLATGRSFRRAASGVMRRHGQGHFILDAQSHAGGLDHHILFSGSAQGQTVRLNGKSMAATSALGRALAAVIFTSETTARLVRGGPRERRNHLDWFIFSRQRGHAPLVRDYQRALKARNQLLKGSRLHDAQMSAFEAQLAALGAVITLSRVAHLADLEHRLKPLLPRLALERHRFELSLKSHLLRAVRQQGTGADERAGIQESGQPVGAVGEGAGEAQDIGAAGSRAGQRGEASRPSGQSAGQVDAAGEARESTALAGIDEVLGSTGPGGIDEALRERIRQRAVVLLHESRENDRRLGTTTIGPHRDDLRFRMDGHALTRYASQGQQKRFVLGLKLAEAALVEEGSGEPPLVILDDPASELDSRGIDHLITLLAERKGQIFLSTCHPGEIPWAGGPHTTHRVTAGAFTTDTAVDNGNVAGNGGAADNGDETGNEGEAENSTLSESDSNRD